jgi:hypothetical protein
MGCSQSASIIVYEENPPFESSVSIKNPAEDDALLEREGRKAYDQLNG